MSIVKHHRTSDSAERYTSLPLNGEERAVYSLSVPGLKSGDILIAFGEAEFSSNETERNVGVWSRLLLTQSELSPSGVELSESNGRNITPEMHHDTHTKVGSGMVANDGDYFVMFASRCASTSGTLDVVIENDYGHVSVLVLRDFPTG